MNDSGELSKLIKAATGGDWVRQVILTDEPFVSLRSMDESWANRFLGRKAEVRELVEKFKKHRLVAIVADSGAGKSSLAQAGLVPAFRGACLWIGLEARLRERRKESIPRAQQGPQNATSLNPAPSEKVASQNSARRKNVAP